ncbi:MAG: hypothetical protein WC683_04895 [bacterium]
MVRCECCGQIVPDGCIEVKVECEEEDVRPLFIVTGYSCPGCGHEVHYPAEEVA